MLDAATDYSNLVLCRIAVPNVAVKLESKFQKFFTIKIFQKQCKEESSHVLGTNLWREEQKKKNLQPNSLKPD